MNWISINGWIITYVLVDRPEAEARHKRTEHNIAVRNNTRLLSSKFKHWTYIMLRDNFLDLLRACCRCIYSSLALFAVIAFVFSLFFPIDLIQTYIRQSYYACVSYIDDLIGQVLSAMSQKQLNNRTIIVLTGDHGKSYSSLCYSRSLIVAIGYRWLAVVSNFLSLT